MKTLTRNQKQIDIFTNKEDMANIRPNRGDGNYVLNPSAIY
jgi:hypothetical protein